MGTKVAINGFGRIGRLVARAIIESGRNDIDIVLINDLGPVETNAHLLRFDSIHGRFPHDVGVEGDAIVVGRHKMKVTAIKDPTQLPHKELGRRHRHGVHGHLHLSREGRRASEGGREAGHRLGALRRRGPYRRLRRQPRQADQGSPRHFQRFLHDQLPRAGRQGAQRRHRHRARLHDDDPFLHRRPADARHAAQGPLPRRAPRRSR